MSSGGFDPSGLGSAIDSVRTSMRMIRLAQAYGGSKPVQSIADDFGVARNTVLYAARRAGLPKRSKRKFTEETRAAALAEYQADVPIKLISRKYDMSPALICKLADEAGLPRRHRCPSKVRADTETEGERE